MCAYRYTLFNEELEHVFEEKDLGVVIDSELSFEDHVFQKVVKANNIVGMIRRAFTYLDGESFKRLFVALVRPHLEYAQAVWSPKRKKLIAAVENVQIRASKLVNNLRGYDYEQRLEILKLPTLTYRRARGDMLETYKHFHHYDSDAISERFKPSQRPSRIHDFQLINHRPRDGVFGVQANSFYFRTPQIWNNLPRNVVDVKNINVFKCKLDCHWHDKKHRTREDVDEDFHDIFYEL